MYRTEVNGVQVEHLELMRIGDSHVAIREVPVGEDQDPMYRLSRAQWSINAPDSLTLKFIADYETLADTVEAAIEDRKTYNRPL